MSEDAIEPEAETREIEYHFVKSNYFRVLHVTGAYGGITSNLLIHMNVYGDRTPIPKTMGHEIRADNRIGTETRREGKQGVIREVEADIVIDVETAKAMVHWLNDKIVAVEKIIKKAIEEGNKHADDTE
jgi:hypothetical protein